MKYTKVMEIGGNDSAIDPESGQRRRVSTYYGTSGRTKPTYEEGARDADRLMEMDTGKVYMFDEESKIWMEV